MTTPEPRVRVLVKIHRWKGTLMATCKCPACDRFAAMGRVGVGYAHALATEHAATCPALRLAWLVRELEALRDTWTQRLCALRTDEVETPQVMSDYRDGMYDATDSNVFSLAAILGRLG